MSISIIAVGRMKEKPYRAMADEYLKRLSRYGKFEEVELPDLPEPQNASPAQERQIRQREGESIPYSFHYPYQYDYYYPETGVDEEAVESSAEEAECPCKKKAPEKKKKVSRRRRPS